MIIICTEHNFYEHKFLYWHIMYLSSDSNINLLECAACFCCPQVAQRKKEKETVNAGLTVHLQF